MIQPSVEHSEIFNLPDRYGPNLQLALLKKGGNKIPSENIINGIADQSHTVRLLQYNSLNSKEEKISLIKLLRTNGHTVRFY